MPPIATFIAEERGIGRRDYSTATEKLVEPVISSWQSVYLHRETVIVPAGGSLVTDIQVSLGQVVLLYDFFASIPSSRLVRLAVDAVDSLGVVGHIIDRSRYQTVAAHLLKGCSFLNIIRFTTYNYGDVDEEHMRIGCAGLYTSAEEFYIRIGELPTP